eukprot:2587547-Pleurochrysis_carterae.AAC.2
MDAVLHEMMNITDEVATTNAKKVKAMRTNVGWFSLPSCALIYTSARSTSPRAHRREGLAVARRGAPLQGGGAFATTSCLAPSRTCWPSAALATRSSSSTQPSLSALLAARQLAHLPGGKGRSGRRLAGSCAVRSSPASAPRASWRR